MDCTFNAAKRLVEMSVEANGLHGSPTEQPRSLSNAIKAVLAIRQNSSQKHVIMHDHEDF